MSQKLITHLCVLTLLCISHSSVGATADECEIKPFPAINSQELNKRNTPLADDETLMSADQMSREGEVITLQGDARLINNQQRISADELIYDQPNDNVNLKDRVNYQTDSFLLQSDSGEFHPDQNSGTFENNLFQLPEYSASGSAKTITIVDEQHSDLKGVSYSTCPPENRAWEMSASTMELDQESNTGEAYNVTLRFKNIPFLYLPYINFALEGRKTGLLSPTIVSSDRNGTDIAIPWYWNIAPQYDATITPRFIQKRGTMLMSEYRFLTPYGGGEINLDYLPGDNALSDNSRHFSRFSHRYAEDGWYGSVNINSVSDDNYLNDLGNSIVDEGSARLEQRIEHGYRNATLNLKLNLQSYQELTASTIYRRLPQLTIAWNPVLDSDLNFSLNTEWTRFNHESTAKVTGRRLDIKPTLSYPIESASGFIRPKLTLRHTRYQLDNNSANPSRSLPILSLDSGLFFDRYFQLGKAAYQQTLEPRLYYLYSPYVDQDSYPNFDTSTVAFSWNQLFQDNRFSGADRQIDANQVSLAVSSRFIESSSGIERLRLSAGKIVTLSDPQVDLGTLWSGSNYENLIAEIAFRPHSEWLINHNQQFTPKGESTLRTTTVSHTSSQYGRATLSYRKDDSTNLLQSDLNANLKLNHRWHLIGRRLHDINQQQTLDAILGFEYESCCWIGRLVTRNEWKSDTMKLERSYLFNIELKGLGRVGQDIESILGSGIIAP
ncbi:MAG: LPS assembly protein LptD [Gammaproteobacteria bacterium]|nr:LPS assembly protein LptD [Gammaproteobacteria bacterium]